MLARRKLFPISNLLPSEKPCKARGVLLVHLFERCINKKIKIKKNKKTLISYMTIRLNFQ